MATDKNAEQLRARDLFEDGVKKWPNYSERTLVRDGRYPDYYGSPVVQGAWEGFKLGLNARADSGEAVAWLVVQKNRLSQGPMYRTKEEALACGVADWEIDEVIPLFAHPNATAVAVQDAAKFVYDAFAKDLGDGYKTRDKVFAIEVLGKALSLPTAIASREGEGK